MAKIINLKTKGDIRSLIENNFNGLLTKFIVNDDLSNKKDKIINLFSFLIDNLIGYDFMYEGKINYGFRNKRIDVVIYKMPILFLGNYSEIHKADKKSIELDKVIDSEKNIEEYENIKIYGCLFFDDDLKKDVADNIKKLLNNEIIYFNIKDKKIIDIIKKCHI